jgi:protein SCO1
MSTRALGLGLICCTGLAAAALVAFGSLCLRPGPSQAVDADARADCCAPTDGPDRSDVALPLAAANADAAEDSRPIKVPDVELVDQHGRAVRFYSDLVKGRLVAINFIFTTCKGVCPPIGATFGKLSQALEDQGVHLISVSVDPVNDTPERLAAWAAKFGAQSNWTLVTGTKQDVDGLLKGLGVFSSDKANHSPLILLGNDRALTWRRIHGLSPLETIRAAIDTVRKAPGLEASAAVTDAKPAEEPISPAHRYFTDVSLVNQYGERMRLYSDLIRSKVVVIHVFFASCKNTCPLLATTFQKLQEHLGDRLGRDVHLISITVDPQSDDQKVLEDYSRRLGARQGWYLLTGPSRDVETALAKLGLAVARRDEHSNIFLIGNEKTGLWKKVRGLGPADSIIEVLDGVIADRGEPSAQVPAPVQRGGD